MTVFDEHTAPPEQAAPEDGRTRRRLRPEERRDEILSAALAVFAEVGYKEATLNDVVERLGVTKGCLYHYFDSKEQLLLALLRERMVPLVRAHEDAVAEGGTSEEVLRKVLEQIWRHFQKPGQIELAVLAMNELPKLPELRRFLFEEIVVAGRQALRQALQRGVDPARMTQAEIDAAAAVIPSMIMGVALSHHLFGTTDPAGRSPEEVGRAVTGVILRGLLRACGDGE